MITKQINCDKLNLDPDILVKAWDGDAVAQLKLGKALFIKNDYINAFELLLESAKQGNMEAQFRLADLYALGQGTQKSQENAYRWYTRAALQGYKKSLVRIHNLYQQDKRMYCRGQLNFEEELWTDEEFQKKNNIRELNEYRREQYAPILNNAVDYYTDKFRCYKSPHQENTEFDLNLAFLYQHGYGTKKNILLAFDFYKKAAEQGHRDAQYNLAYLYQHSPHIKFNYRHALRWYRASATNGNIAAQNCLGYFYEKGMGTGLSFKGALYWYTKAAYAGNSNAQLTLGRLYRKGQGVTQSLSEAAKWYQLAANQGNSAAQNCLNQLYLAGKLPIISNSNDVILQSPVTLTLCSKLQKEIIKLRDSACIKKLKLLAQHALMTDGSAMYQIGLKYYNGEDFSQDKDAGVQWIKKAAKAGFEEAESKIAEMYQDGEERDQDYHKSSIWTMKTVKKRSDTSMLKLGILYKNGLGVRKDPLEASKWFLKSAEEGNPHAQFQFGLLKYHGEGVRKDKDEASSYFFRAALLKNTDALYQLGHMYENGDFAGRDIPRKIQIFKSPSSEEDYELAESFKMYKAAANLGGQDAQFKLAKIYEEGKLVEQKLEKAHKYYMGATKSGNPRYQTELALKYINGVFEDKDYIKAYDLFKKAAEKGEHRAVRIFQTPIQQTGDINDYSKVINMFILAASRGITGLEYNIGYAYEHGIMLENEIVLPQNYSCSKYWYSIAARSGHSRAEYNTKVMLEHGNQITSYLNMAYDSYHLVYEHGNSEISYSLALVYQRGEYGEPQDYIKSFNLFTAASNMGHAGARKKLMCSNDREDMKMLEEVAYSGNIAVQYQLGVYFESKNDSKSVQWLTLAAEGGLSDAWYRLGVLYEEGKIIPADYSKAIDLYSKAIENNHENALYKLAQIHHYGKGTDRNYLQAYILYTRAAGFGHIGALKVLDLDGEQEKFLLKRMNVETTYFTLDDPDSAISMLKSVAKQGDARLQFKLGCFYENDKDNQSYSEAFKWYEMAAKKRHTEAIYRLGLLYEKGLGVNQNYHMSIQLYNQARDQGSHHALYRLGIAFHHGYGVDQNPIKAVAFYTKAAKLGNHKAQYILGRLYERAELVQGDLMKALVLYTNAYKNENTDALSRLYDLYDDQPYEYFFNQKLFRILSRIEKEKKMDIDKHQTTYGYIHYRLGKMYLEGIGTQKDPVKALKNFLKAKNRYKNSDEKHFTAWVYDEKNDKEEDYIERMEAYFRIRDSSDLGNELQYKIGMLLYREGKCYCAEHQKVENKASHFAATSKKYCTAFQYLSLAANKNHKKAQYQLGMMYLLGHGVQQSELEAIEWIKKSIEEMKPHQCYKIGVDFYYGKGDKKNYNISYIYFKRAAQQDYLSARLYLYKMYLHGYGVEKSEEKANEWVQKSIRGMDKYDCYKQGMKFYKGYGADRNYSIALTYFTEAAENRSPDAMSQLAIMYLHGYGVEPNEEEANRWIQQSMEQMDGRSCYLQGMKFYEGVGVDRNYSIALNYLKNAEKKKNADAMGQLAIMYLHGYGVEKSEEEANRWIQQSIKQMDERNFYTQGMKFYNGDSVDRNYTIALTYFTEAAEKNDADAMTQIAIMYLHGYGVEKNEEEANKWIQQSIKQMDGNSCYEQGIEFCENDCVDRNYSIALTYFTEAAEKKNTDAMTYLVKMHLHGYGVEQNEEEANRWIQKSIEQMDGNSCYKQGMKFYWDETFEKNYSIALTYFEEAVKKYKSESINKNYRRRLPKMHLAAGENYGAAMGQLAIMYLHGYGVEKSEEKANGWIQQSIKQMNGNDCYEQGMKFYKGDGVDRNYTIALTYFTEAAVKSNSDAMGQLAIMYLHGYDVEKNEEEANGWIQQSIKQMNGNDCYEQGMKFYEGDGVDRNYSIALTYFTEAVKKYKSESINRNYDREFPNMYLAAGGSYGTAMTQLAIMYLHGYGVEKSEEKANGWIQQSIKQMNGNDCYEQGMKFYKGDGVDRNYSISLSYFTEAVEKKKADAVTQLAIMHLHGYGVEKSEEEANRWIQQSIKQMNGNDCYEQGMKFYKSEAFEINYRIALTYFTEAAEKSNPDAMTQLIKMYLHEYGVEKNEEEANRWLQQSIEQMDENHCYEQGMKFYEGDGVDRNYSIALTYFTEAVKKYKSESINRNYSRGMSSMHLAAGESYGDAMGQLAIMYLHGYGVEKSEEKANGWIQQSIKQMNGNDCYKQGMKFYEGNGVDRNYSISLSYFTEAVEKKNADAVTQLAIMHLHGYGVEKSEEEANRWIQQSIKQMDGNSCYKQGMKFYKGDGVDKNYIIALTYFKEAIEKHKNESINRNYSRGFPNMGLAPERNYGTAMTQLAIMYLHGYGVEKNEEEANKWIQQSIKQMDGNSCYKQGMKFYKGDGVDRNYTIALTYFKEAIEKHKNESINRNYNHIIPSMHLLAGRNYGTAVTQLAIMYLHGYGVDRNYSIALTYFTEAAEKKNADAMTYLVKMHLHGYVVEQNEEEANRWIQKSIEQMDGNSCYKQGMEFYRDETFEKNHSIALTYFEEAVKKYKSESINKNYRRRLPKMHLAAGENYGAAMGQLAIMYLHGYGVEKSEEKANGWIQQSIKQMNGNDCYEQGMKFYKGDGVDRNYSISLSYFTEAVKKYESESINRNYSRGMSSMHLAAGESYGDAMGQLAIMYLHGYGVEKSEEKANGWIQQSIKQMNGNDCYKQGMKFYEGNGVDRNYSISLSYFTEAVEKKNADAVTQLAIMHLHGYGVEKSEEEANRWIQQSIKQMDGNSCYKQGMKFYEGDGVDRNYSVASIYLKEAADKGHVYSKTQLAHMYLNGYGVNRDHDEAFHWYNKVIDDYPSCPAFIIGRSYHFDSGGIQDFSEAFKWYDRELDPSDIGFSLHGIGLLYEYGDGVSQNFKEAFEHYDRAMRLGKIGGYYNLALLYYHGRGVDQSYDRAFTLFTKIIDDRYSSEEMYVFVQNDNINCNSIAVEATHRKYSLVSSKRIRGEANYYIGLMYENGQGRVQDKLKAINHFKKAFEHGVECALNFLK